MLILESLKMAGKKKSHSSKKEPPKALAPEYSEVLRSGTPNSAKQVTEDHSDETILSLKVTREDIQKELEENIDDSERNPKILENINGKASRHRRKKGKNDPSNQRSLDIGKCHLNWTNSQTISLDKLPNNPHHPLKLGKCQAPRPSPCPP
jgi:hypothetical protein